MRDDYLWDGSGEPDPEIQKLETELGKLRHNRAAPAFPEITIQPQSARRRFWQIPLFPRFAVAAGILAIAAISFVMIRQKPNPNSGAGWDVTRVTGAPRIGRDTLGAQNATGKLGVGQMLETDSRSQANIRVEEVGEIVVGPDSRLRLPDTKSGVKRLALDRGTIHASIWAPAGEFVIDTPSATAVDLGCAYTLHVDDSGNGVLHTTLGWVGFKLADRESFIPAGAACSTKRKTGPGTPYLEDASPAFLSALSTFDLESSTPDERATALQVVLAQSRKRDALTLWHLLTRVAEPDRGRVYDRLAHFVPAPAGVTREGILRLDRNMLDLWWNELGFGDVGLWRHWERTWSEQGAKSNK
jgi:hypothetical protein